MAIESAGSLLEQTTQVDRLDHEAIQSGTGRACLQCNNSFKSISELGQHATKLQHGGFQVQMWTTVQEARFARASLDQVSAGSTPVFMSALRSVRGWKRRFTREDNPKQHLRVYHRVNYLTKFGEYKKCYLKAWELQYFCELVRMQIYDRSDPLFANFMQIRLEQLRADSWLFISSIESILHQNRGMNRLIIRWSNSALYLPIHTSIFKTFITL